MNAGFTLTRQQARELDSIAIGQYGIKGLILMENAGRACATEAADMLARSGGRYAVVFCGSGNNGGDGFVVGRHLANRGIRVVTFLVGKVTDALRKAGDAAVNLEISLKMDIPVRELEGEESVRSALAETAHADLIVDALLGTGTTGDVREPYLSIIAGINELRLPVLGVDIPSGLDCDTGKPLGIAVRATRTVTFVALKRGFL